MWVALCLYPMWPSKPSLVRVWHASLFRRRVSARLHNFDATRLRALSIVVRAASLWGSRPRAEGHPETVGPSLFHGFYLSLHGPSLSVFPLSNGADYIGVLGAVCWGLRGSVRAWPITTPPCFSRATSQSATVVLGLSGSLLV